jgi:hypothetical protein
MFSVESLLAEFKGDQKDGNVEGGNEEDGIHQQENEHKNGSTQIEGNGKEEETTFKVDSYLVLPKIRFKSRRILFSIFGSILIS